MAFYKTANDTVSAHAAVAVTKSDVTVFDITRALYVGSTGDVAVRMADGMTITFKTVPVGILPIQVDQVRSTGTTASEIIALR